MKTLSIALLTALSLIGCASTPAPFSALPSLLVVPNTKKTSDIAPDAYVDGVGMLHFKEYHAKVPHKDKTYLLDSYVVPFQQPFYLHVRTTDGTPIIKEMAVQIAIDYITPKGCTEPLVRRPELDRHTPDKTEWIVGVAC